MVRVGVMLMSVTSVMSPLVSALSPSLVLLIKAGTSILYLTAPGPPSSLLCEPKLSFELIIEPSLLITLMG